MPIAVTSDVTTSARPDCTTHALRFETNPTGGEYQLTVTGLSLAGSYNLSANVLVTADYDGDARGLHSRFWGADGEIGNAPSGAWVTTEQRNSWYRVSYTFDTGSAVPTYMHWYIGYPQQNSNGHMLFTGLSIKDPTGRELLADGSFAGGANLAAYDASGSYGRYNIVETCGNWWSDLRFQLLNARIAILEQQNTCMRFQLNEVGAECIGYPMVGANKVRFRAQPIAPTAAV